MPARSARADHLALACPRVALVDHLDQSVVARGGDPLAPVYSARGVTALGLTYLGLLQIRNCDSALVLNLPEDFATTLNLDLAIGDRPRHPTGGAD